jgi:hypothetical protein
MLAKPLRGIVVVGLAAAALSLSGCGGAGLKTAPVRGRVTYQGRPVPNGTVAFIPDGGTASTGEIGPDGSYTLTTVRKGDGAIPGRHKVVITALKDTTGQAVEAWGPLPPPIIPTKYMNLATTDLRAEVKDGENTIDFDLR